MTVEKPDLFKEILPAILRTKESLSFEKESYYPAYIVNKALSFHMDCILYANEMNMRPDLPANAQFQFLLNTIRPWKRPFAAWLKKEKIDDLECVKSFYNFSNEKAKAALEVLSEDQLAQIRERMNRGGFNDKSRRTGRGETET